MSMVQLYIKRIRPHLSAIPDLEISVRLPMLDIMQDQGAGVVNDGPKFVTF